MVQIAVDKRAIAAFCRGHGTHSGKIAQEMSK